MRREEFYVALVCSPLDGAPTDWVRDHARMVTQTLRTNDVAIGQGTFRFEEDQYVPTDVFDFSHEVDRDHGRAEKGVYQFA